MSDLDAVLVGIVLGLAFVGAVLRRNEEEVREAWRQRRGEPKAGNAARWTVAGFGLIAIANIGLAVADGGAIRIILAALWLLLFLPPLAEIEADSTLYLMTTVP